MRVAAIAQDSTNLLARPSMAEIDKTASVCGDRICLRWWPKLPTVPGWHRHEEQSARDKKGHEDASRAVEQLVGRYRETP